MDINNVILASKGIRSGESILSMIYIMENHDVAYVALSSDNDPNRENAVVFFDDVYLSDRMTRKKVIQYLVSRGLGGILEKTKEELEQFEDGLDIQLYVEGVYERGLQYLIQNNITVEEVYFPEEPSRSYIREKE